MFLSLYKKVLRCYSGQALRCDSGQALRCDSGQALRCDSGQALRQSSGQAMLVMMLFMGALIFSATAVTGLLFSYQVRQAGDSEKSAQAVLAADAGIERTLYCYYFTFQRTISSDDACDVKEIAKETLGNGAKYSTSLTFDVSGVPTVVQGFWVSSSGEAGTARRFINMYYSVR